MISVENLSKSFGAQLLFDNISFKVNRRERVGLVGRNGHGKTTLFRIIAGLESSDSGSVSIPKNYRIGYVEQEPTFTGRNGPGRGGPRPPPGRAGQELAGREDPGGPGV